MSFVQRTFVSVYAENVKVRVSLCGERQSSRQFMRRTSKFVSVYAENVKVCVYAENSLCGERQSLSLTENVKVRVSLCGERQSSCQFMRRTAKFVSVYAENVKVRVSLCGERQSSRQFRRRT